MVDRRSLVSRLFRSLWCRSLPLSRHRPFTGECRTKERTRRSLHAEVMNVRIVCSQMGPRVRRRVGSCALLVTIVISPCVHAQAVRGQLVGQSVQRPVPGALVLLVDHAGRQINRTVTDGSGRFLVAASNAGEFSLLVLRIGYQTWHSPAFRLTVGDTLEYRGEVQETPIPLPAVSVEARRQCRLAQDAGEIVAALWDEAKKALMLTEVTREHSAFEFRIVRSTRRVNNSLATLEETSDTALLTTYTPFISLPADSLVHAGFVQDSAGDHLLRSGCSRAFFGRVPPAPLLQVSARAVDRAQARRACVRTNQRRVGSRNRGRSLAGARNSEARVRGVSLHQA